MHICCSCFLPGFLPGFHAQAVLAMWHTCVCVMMNILIAIPFGSFDGIYCYFWDSLTNVSIDCPLIFFQTVIGAVVSAPMNPIGASSMFFLSYARPVKFWEKDYK